MSEAELHTNHLTEEEIKKLREEFKKNELYQQSVSLCKDYQFEQFCAGEDILEGRHSRVETINGKEVLVIYTFKNGLIHSENDLPAVEYPMHWEYWKDGLPYKIVKDYSKSKNLD